MAGTPIAEFTTLMASQGPAWASGAEVIINETVRRRYTHTRIQAGKRMDEMVQGGDEIKDTIFLEMKSTWERYNPNAGFSPPNLQTGHTWTIPWAFGTAYMSWTKHELGLNKDTTTAKYRAQRYKAVMFQKHQNLFTDICNSLEDELWATPDQTNMDSATPTGARIPYSIPCFITENDSGGLPLGDLAASWTTDVAGINPTTQTNWRNQRQTYGSGTTAIDFGTAAGSAVIFPAMSRLLHNLRFDRLPKHGSYSDKTTSPHVILCSLSGITNYESALRLNQDEFRGIGKTSGQDPDYHNPTFRNVPIDYVDSLDTALLYDSGSTTTVAEADADLAGPRYYFVNGEYLNFVWHSENYCVLEEPEKLTAAGKPFTMVQYVDCWNNLVPRSRKRQGILTPFVDITNAA